MSNLTRTRRERPDIAPDTPICSKCREVNDRPPYRYCRSCHAEYMKSWRVGRVDVPRETNVSHDEEHDHIASAVASLEGKAA